MEAVIDTNALVYDYVEDSQFHEEAGEALERADAWVVPSVVLEEFVLVMKKAKLDDDLLRSKIEEMLSDGRTLFTPLLARDVRSAVRFLSSEKASFVGFNDKLVLSVASRRKASLLTFDKELRAESRRLGIKTLP